MGTKHLTWAQYTCGDFSSLLLCRPPLGPNQRPKGRANRDSERMQPYIPFTKENYWLYNHIYIDKKIEPKEYICSNFILSTCLLIMLDTLLLRPSLYCNTSLHLTKLQLHFTTLINTSLPLIYTSLPSHLA